MGIDLVIQMSERNCEIYEAHVKQPQLSYTRLARLFNVTRNTVAGAIWRGRQAEKQARA